MPPSRADAFLSWFCPPELIEDIQGDLYELFEVRVQQDGLGRAKLWYWWNVCWFLRPYILRRRRNYPIARGPIMWKNYATVAWRQLRRAPLYSGINIAGLALGIACCILMLLFVRDELTFDRMHTQADQIYRIVEQRVAEQGDVRFIADTAGPVGPTMVADLPEVNQSVRIVDRGGRGRFTLRQGERERHEGAYLYAETSFLEVFDFPLLAGNRATALTAPNSVLLTETGASFYFGHTDVLGKTISDESGVTYTVTGLMADPPNNSHLQFEVVFSWASLEANENWLAWLGNWDSSRIITYVVLNEAASPEAVTAKLEAFSNQYRTAEAWAARSYTLQPLPAIHFDSGYIESEHNSGKSTRSTLYIFTAIALLIALIASINYMNLATARAMKRAREVGLRKVIGAYRGQLVGQFLGESVLTALLGMVLAIGLVLLVLPAFNSFTGKALTLAPTSAWPVLLGMLGMTLLVGLVSGSYPALYVAQFRPAQVLKGFSLRAQGVRWLREGLVVMQFSLSIILIVATLGAYQQFSYIQDRDLGFNQSHLVTLDINSRASRENFEGMKAGYRQIAAVEAVSVTSRVPGDWKVVPTVEVRPEGSMSEDLMSATFMGVDADFLDTYQITLADGRNFSEALATDSSALLINETAARLFGWDSANEQTLSLLNINFGGRQFDAGYDAQVIGIVKDFHFESLHADIRPLVLGFRNNPLQSIDYYTLRVQTADLEGLLAQVVQVHTQFDPTTPMEVNYLDQRLEEAYVQDRRDGTVFGVATSLALLIACFGLFGLAAYLAEQRTKEIGVRKVMGATVGGLIVMMSASFTRLVGIAFLVATPVAWWLTNRWLDNFAYHTRLGLGTLLLAGFAALMLAWLTVSYQALKAATTDPIHALRYE